MKRLYYIFGLGLLFFTVSCTTNPLPGEDVTNESVRIEADMQLAPNDVVGTWHGFIPCAGCTASGVTYDLVLLDDYTFEETFIKDEQEGEPIYRTGAWSIEDGQVALEGSEDERTKFALSTTGELLMLDLAGKPVNKDLQAQYKLTRGLGNSGGNAALSESERKIGVDFVATGHDPGWLLEIDQEEEIFFKTRPLEDVVLNATLATPVKEGDLTHYSASTEAGEITVELMKQVCTDAMSGKERPYSVRVEVKGKVYTGCGLYLVEK